MDAAAIADPRTFPDLRAAPQDAFALYALADRIAAVATLSEQDALAANLRDELSSRLRANAERLAAIFAGAPSVDVARTLWRALDAAWRDAVASASGVATTLFALPVVVVAAASAGAGGTLGATLDAPALVAVLREHRALRGNESIAVANTLVAPEALDIARLPLLLAHAAGPLDLAPAPIDFAAGHESVHARLVVGSALAAPGIDLLDGEPARGWAMAFTRELVRQLAAPAATVLALPGAPAHPLQAVRAVRAAQREVAAQVFVANALRAFRSRSGEPVAIVSAHRAPDAPGGGELRLSLSSPFEPRDAEGFRCPLYPLDRAADVARMLVALLEDCRVADIRVVAGVHADRVDATSQRLLFKPDTAPPDTAAMH